MRNDEQNQQSTGTTASDTPSQAGNVDMGTAVIASPTDRIDMQKAKEHPVGAPYSYRESDEQ